MSQAPNNPPNFIFILADDLGWRDISCYGSNFYETPNLDRLAQRGMRFTDAYASCPVCSPTRASVHTGKYPARVGITNWIGGKSQGRLQDVPYLHELPLSEQTLATALREGGYQTWHVGKWHMGGPEFYPQHHGFDINIGGCGWGSPKKGYQAPWGIENLPEAADGTWLDQHLADEASRLIKERDTSKPFFLNFALYLVHTPLRSRPELIEKYEQKRQMLGINELTDELVDGEAFPCEHKKDLRMRRRTVQGHPVYAGMVQQMDEAIGSLLDALDAAGVADNTVIVFTSDNGGLATAEGSPTCNAPLSEGKGWMYEGGVREPLIVYAPGVTPADSTCTEPVTSTDFYPTFLEMAGLPSRPEQHVDGISITAALKNPKHTYDRDLFWHYPHYSNQGDAPAAAIRSGDYKLIEHFEDGRVELFNLRTDVSENYDLASEKPELRDQLHTRLKAWQQDIEAKIPEPNPNFEKWPGLKPLPGVDPAWV